MEAGSGWISGFAASKVIDNYPASPDWDKISEREDGFKRPDEGQEGYSHRDLEVLFGRAVKYVVHKRKHALDAKELNRSLEMAKKAIIIRCNELYKRRPMVNRLWSNCFDKTLNVLRERSRDVKFRLQKARLSSFASLENPELRTAVQNLEKLESLMNGNSSEQIIEGMVAENNGREPMYSSNGYDQKIWDDQGELTYHGKSFTDCTHIDFLSSIGRGPSDTDEAVGCVLCGRAVMKNAEQRECVVCKNTYCLSCVWPINVLPASYQRHGCRRCNGSVTWMYEAISKHPYGLCGDDQCCGTGEAEGKKPHYCRDGCYVVGYRNGKPNHFDGCKFETDEPHREYDHRWFRPHGPVLYPGETRLAPTIGTASQLEGFLAGPEKQVAEDAESAEALYRKHLYHRCVGRPACTQFGERPQDLQR